MTKTTCRQGILAMKNYTLAEMVMAFIAGAAAAYVVWCALDILRAIVAQAREDFLRHPWESSTDHLRTLEVEAHPVIPPPSVAFPRPQATGP
jgi:hypothetical protein